MATEANANSSAPKQLTSEEFLDRLRNALLRDGDFPASARIVNELRTLTCDPKTTANQITEIILKEPSLGTRVLHVVNSSFYRRAKPIMTVSQAVVQIGMKPLADMCAGLVLLQKFVPAARSGGPFAGCLQKTVLSSLLSSSIAQESSKNAPIRQGHGSESGYLAGSFAELGTLLLAYYFPQVYENALKRTELKKQSLVQSIKDVVGLTPIEISMEVVKALHLPEFYSKVLKSVHQPEPPRPAGGPVLPPEAVEVTKVAKSVNAAKDIAHILVFSKNKQELDNVLATACKQLDLNTQIINKMVGDLPKVFKDHCSSIDLHLPALPEFVSTYLNSTAENTASAPAKTEIILDEDVFNRYVEEIRSSVESGEPTASVITTVMETLAWGLHFDRVLLLLATAGRKSMVGRMMLGTAPNFDPTKFERVIGPEAPAHAPDARAHALGHPVFNGDSLFENGWPIAVLPIGFGQRCVGVIYCDREDRGEAELSSREQASVGILAELLDRSISRHS